MGVAIAVIGVIAFLIVIVLGSAIPVLRDYERGVIFRLGRPIAQKGPRADPQGGARLVARRACGRSTS